jgi:hypothetical protein
VQVDVMKREKDREKGTGRESKTKMRDGHLEQDVEIHRESETEILIFRDYRYVR